MVDADGCMTSRSGACGQAKLRWHPDRLGAQQKEAEDRGFPQSSASHRTGQAREVRI